MLVEKIVRKVKTILKAYSSAILSRFNNPYIAKDFKIESTGDYKLSIPKGIKFCSDFDVFLKPVCMVDLEKDSGQFWYKDFMHGYQWRLKWHKLLSYKLKRDSDVKVPWELGRGHIFCQQALAVSLGDIPLSSFRRLLNNFSDGNPVGYGVQWQCSMDVSIRLVNLIISKMIINAKSGIDPELDRAFNKQFLEHYNYVTGNPEIFHGGLKNNHYLADLMGRAWFYSFVSGDVEAANDLLVEIETEFLSQFLEDGGNFEGSTSYHCLSLEIVLLSICAIAHLFEASNKSTNIKKIEERLIRAIEFARFFSSSAGYPCRVGDDDSGMVIRPYDFSRVIDAERNRVLFARRCQAFSLFLQRYLSGGLNATFYSFINTLFGYENHSISLNSEKSYPNFGLYKYSHGGVELYLRHLHKLGCNGLGGHNHQDDFSVEVFNKGNPIIVDPGTYCYTSNPDRRNLYRSSEYHNSIAISGRSDFNFTPGQRGLFGLVDKPGVSSSYLSVDDCDAISSNRTGLMVERKIFSDGGITILDSIQLGAAKLRFNLWPGLDAFVAGGEVVIIGSGSELKLSISGYTKIEVLDYMYSDFYLSERSAKVIVVHFEGQVKTQIAEGCLGS